MRAVVWCAVEALLTQDRGAVYIEVHPDVYRRSPVSLTRLRLHAWLSGVDGRIDWRRAAAAIEEREGIAIDVTAPIVAGR